MRTNRMGKKTNSRLIGTFVVGATALIVGLIAFRGGRCFTEWIRSSGSSLARPSNSEASGSAKSRGSQFGASRRSMKSEFRSTHRNVQSRHRRRHRRPQGPSRLISPYRI